MGACARPGTGAYGSGWRAAACCAGKSQVYWGPIKGLGNGSLCEARDGSLWIGLEGNGLLRWKEPSLLHYDRTNGLGGNFVRAICEGKDGSMWIATRGGLSRYRDGEFHTFTREEDRKSTRLNSSHLGISYAVFCLK